MTPARVVAALLLATAASGYYHFVRFNSTGAPYQPLFERFDLNALPNRTVQFFIGEQSPTGYFQGDSYAAVVSQIRAAARVWNDVETSDLRLQYGGVAAANTPQSTPGIDVVFSDEIPPGVVALGGPTTRGDITVSNDATFVPILRSVVMLPRDLSRRPSWSERFFLTVVHEFGHALGLQHTLTSAAMSTELTRGVTKARPLEADDIAGLSLLYPTRTYLAGTAAISGRVTMNGAGVNMGSVVAVHPTGPAVSTLTNPDGTFRLAGLPPGTYVLYVHSLPPALEGEAAPANIVLPSDPGGRLNPTLNFQSQFLNNSFPVTLQAGASISNLNVSVQPRSDDRPIYAVQSYSFFGNNPVKPAFFNRNAGRGSVIASGVNLTRNNAPVPGLSARVVDNIDTVAALGSYSSDPAWWVQADLALSSNAPEGPRHLVLSTPSDLYLLPAAYRVAAGDPPSIANAVTTPEGVRITGQNLSANTRILFDGVPAAIRRADEGGLWVTPPATPFEHRPALTALNPDGQSSLFLTGDAVTFHNAADGREPVTAFTLSPAALPAGVETFVEINGVNTGFVQGETRVGFGSSDVLVRRLWVFSPTRLLAEVTVLPGAAQTSTTVTVSTGLRQASAPVAFTTQPAATRQISLSHTVLDPVPAGSAVTLTVQNLPANTGVSVTVGGRPASIRSVNGNQVTFTVPSVGNGLAVVSLTAGPETSLPTLLYVETPVPVLPPVLASVLAEGSSAITPFRPARRGEALGAMSFNIIDANGPVSDRSRLRIFVGDVEHQVLVISPNQQFGSTMLTFVLLQSVPTGEQPIRVTVDGRSSFPLYIPVR
ncbi:MAG: IPT/TIG domain-containing protein [Bryobacteraceae bacterium]|nr:IPT/TIG domain-containing protein [Bryobacteraceae bacterium]